MDFLKNAAKIAQEVQGKKKKHEGEGSGGFGDLMGGFMGGGEKPKPKPHEEYERPHGSSQYDAEMPHNAGAAQKKKPSTSELFGSAQVLYQAAAGKKVDQGKLAGAASDLLDGLSQYGENSPYGDYLKKASTYLDQYGHKHEIPVAQGSTVPPSGRPSEVDEEFHPPKPRPSKYDSEGPESRPSKPRPSKYEEEEVYGAHPQKPRPSRYEYEESEYSGRPQKPHPSSEEFEYGGRPQKPRPSQYEYEDSEYSGRPQKPHPSKYEEEGEYGVYPPKPRPSKYEEGEYGVYPPKPHPHGPYEAEEAGYGGRPQKPRPSRYEEEEEYDGPRRPQKSQAPQYEDEEHGSGYSRKPHKPEHGEERPGSYGNHPQKAEGPYGSSEGPYGSAYGAASKPGYSLEEEYGKPKKSWYE